MYIKKIILVIVMCFCMTSCSDMQSSAYPNVSLDSADCNIEYCGKNFSAQITNIGNLTSVRFTAPSTVDGMTYILTSDKCEISFGELKYSSQKNQLDNSALPMMIHLILSSSSPEELTEISHTDVNAVFGGVADVFRFDLQCDRSTGSLREISSEKAHLKVSF